MKHHRQKQLVEESVPFSLELWFIIEEVRTGTEAEQELESGTEAEAMEKCCILSCSVCILIKPRTYLARGRVIHSRLCPTYWSLNQKIPHSIVYSLILQKHFLNVWSFMSDDSSLSEVVRKL